MKRLIEMINTQQSLLDELDQTHEARGVFNGILSALNEFDYNKLLKISLEKREELKPYGLSGMFKNIINYIQKELSVMIMYLYSREKDFNANCLEVFFKHIITSLKKKDYKDILLTLRVIEQSIRRREEKIAFSEFVKEFKDIVMELDRRANIFDRLLNKFDQFFPKESYMGNEGSELIVNSIKECLQNRDMVSLKNITERDNGTYFQEFEIAIMKELDNLLYENSVRLFVENTETIFLKVFEDYIEILLNKEDLKGFTVPKGTILYDKMIVLKFDEKSFFEIETSYFFDL